MNWVDIVIAAVLIIWIIRGFVIGFALALATLLGVVAGTVCAMLLSPYLADMMKNWIENGQVRSAIAYLLIFLVVATLFRILGLLLKNALKKLKLEGPDAVMGGIMSGLEGLLLMTVVILFIAQSPWADGRAAISKSASGPYFLRGAKLLISTLPEDTRKQIEPLLEPRKVREQDDEEYSEPRRIA